MERDPAEPNKNLRPALMPVLIPSREQLDEQIRALQAASTVQERIFPSLLDLSNSWMTGEEVLNMLEKAASDTAGEDDTYLPELKTQLTMNHMPDYIRVVMGHAPEACEDTIKLHQERVQSLKDQEILKERGKSIKIPQNMSKRTIYRNTGAHALGRSHHGRQNLHSKRRGKR
jgi:hypothetical protein